MVASGFGGGVGRGGSGVFATVRAGSSINMNPAMFRSRSGDGGGGSSRSRRVLDRQASAIHQATMIRQNAAIQRASFARVPTPPTGAGTGGVGGGSGSGRLGLVGGSTQRSLGVSGGGDGDGGGSGSYRSVYSGHSNSETGKGRLLARGGDSESSVPRGAFSSARARAGGSRRARIAALEDNVDSSVGSSVGSSGFDTSASGRQPRWQQHKEQQPPKGIAFRPAGHSRSKSSGSGGSGDSTIAATLAATTPTTVASGIIRGASTATKAATTSTTVASGIIGGPSARGQSHRPAASAGDLDVSLGGLGGSGGRGTASAAAGRPTATVASLRRDSNKSGVFPRDASRGWTKVGDGGRGTGCRVEREGRVE